MAEPRQGSDVQLHLGVEALCIELVQQARGAEAGVVDDQIDRGSRILDARDNCGQTVC